MLFLMIFYLVRWSKRYSHIQNQWICNQLCHTDHMLNLQSKKTGNIITLEQFEEGNLLLEYHKCTETGDKSDDKSTPPPFISEARMD